MSEIKQHTTYDKQIEILKSRGCIISNNELCELVLQSVGYYRLTAYFLPFKQDDGTYFPGTCFEKIYNIYEFDRKLRGLIFSAIEVVETNLRATLSYFHSMKYGPLGYLDPTSFSKKHNAIKFKENIDREIENNKKVSFVKHHLENYDGKFPLWVVSELFTFGTLSYFYNDLKTADKKLFAGVFHRDMISWLRCCTDLRNICAHYGRLYYRVFTAVPSGFELQENAERRLWGALLAVKALYPSKENWNQEFLPSLEALFEKYSDDINLKHIAFPIDWVANLKK